MNDNDIVKYYERKYEESGQKLNASEGPSRRSFLEFVFDKLGIDDETRSDIENEMIQYLSWIEEWRTKLNKALERILPFPPKIDD